VRETAQTSVFLFGAVRLSPERMGPLGKPLALPSTPATSRTLAVRAVTLVHSDAGIPNTGVVVCNLYCDQSSDQQVSSGQNLKGLDKLIIIMIYTKHNH